MYARLSVLIFFHFFLWGSWFVTAGTYLISNLEFSGSQIGLIYSTTAISAILSPLAMGVLADRYFSVEKILTILYITGGGLLWWMSYITSFPLFFIAILIYMLVFLPSFSLANSLCFHHVQDARFDFPKIRVWGTIAWIIAGIIVGTLRLEDQPITMRIAGSISFLLAIYCLTLPSTPPTHQSGGTIWEFLKGKEITDLFKDRSFVILISSVAVICIPTAYYYSFVNPFLNEMGVVNAAGKMSIGQVTEIVLMLLLPWIFRIFRLKYIIFTGLFLWGFRYLFFVIGIEYHLEWWYLTGLLVHGAAYIFATLTSQIYLDTRVPRHLRSTAQGFYSFLTFGIGAFVGSIIAGGTVSAFNMGPNQHDWQTIWMIPSVIGIITAFVFLLLFKNKSKT